MTITREMLQERIDEYNKRYNTTFSVTERYSLFPLNGEHGFESTWPNNGLPGVYIIADKNEELLYIGEAKKLGKRLYDHFHGKTTCEIADEKLQDAHFIYTTSCKPDSSWERYSLEGFLISRLDPPRNSRKD